MVGLHGDRPIAVDFYFPDEVISIRQLGDRQTLHRLDERGGFLWKKGRLEFCTHARATYITQLGHVEPLTGTYPLSV